MLFFSITGSILVLFLLIPLIIGVIAGSMHLVEATRDKEALDALTTSFYAASIAGLILVVLGTPLAYFLARTSNRGLGELVESIVNIPLALPHSVVGIIILLAYGSRTPIGSLLDNLGLALQESFWGIVAVMAYVSAPIYVSTLKAGFSMIDQEIEHVARTLGANPLRVYFTITLPLAMKHLIAGYILSLARGISEVGAVMIIAYYPKTAAVLVVERFLSHGLGPALALSALLIIISLVLFLTLRLVLRGLKL